MGSGAGREEDESGGISEVFLSPIASEVPWDMVAGAVYEVVGGPLVLHILAS